MDDLREMLDLMIEATKGRKLPECFKYSSLQDFVLQNGREFDPIDKPSSIKRGIIKECYKNAFEIVQDRPDLTYCEGYADSYLGLPILHAWVATDEGEAIEVTWPTKGASYIGVPFDFEFVRRTIVNKETWGVLDNWMDGFPLLCGTELDFLREDYAGV